MKLNHSIYIFLMTLFVSTYGYAGEDAGEPAHLHSFEIAKGKVMFTVTSSGCTQESDFSVQVDFNSEPVALQVMRHRKDRCRRMPFVKTVTVAVPELESGPPFVLNNIFIAPRVKTQRKVE